MNEKIYDSLKKIIDPELGIDIVTLGLIRKVIIVEDTPHILMTLTTPLCPFADIILQDVSTEIVLAGFLEPKISLSFDPAWEPSEAVKLLLGM